VCCHNGLPQSCKLFAKKIRNPNSKFETISEYSKGNYKIQNRLSFEFAMFFLIIRFVSDFDISAANFLFS